MLRFIGYTCRKMHHLQKISIHPMLRFISDRRGTDIFHHKISIHPMLRFICCHVSNVSAHRNISIHPMLRFIAVQGYGSIPAGTNFNTSHVTVYLPDKPNKSKRKIFQYIPCYGLSIYIKLTANGKNISIHPMLRFIVRKHRITTGKESISIHPMLRFINLCSNFRGRI